ncbi:hypothetical protein GGQ54_002643 [Naumannella cuiyingiana]|uniref:Uncharacterized protein n=1 Tax=Naumannella cuiyingiana TaxID=1347891 RepID=A0A7Z0DAV1_9ACTN|nr:hypothetical protein [Naumannella cuiyingiana]NYI72083.1 hypothetical protein [Naumannella cuiyingiana]
MTTLISYRDRRGRSRWSCLAPVHRRLAPGLLRDAAATMEGLALSAERAAPTAQAEN